MKKRVVTIMMAAAMAASLAACGGSSSSSGSSGESASQETASSSGTASSSASGDSDVQYIKDKGTLIVGITDFAPMDYKDDNDEWIGFDADLARKVAEDLGVDIEFEEIDWDNKILELDNKNVDVLWNGMTLTPEVEKSMETTEAYMDNGQVVVVPADEADKYQSEDDLDGLTFAVEAGSAGEQVANEKGYDVNSLPAQSDALLEVQSHSSDAAIIDLLMAGAMIGEGTSYSDLTHTVQLSDEQYGIGCRKGSDLASYINDELKKFYDDGTTKKLAEQYGVQDAIIEPK